ncbi:MAG: arginine--tRNA ligase [Alphaproteobacteria bacterium]|nr:arginine--tRNA ligase [Alphaproteobacteria bacterium]
MDIRNILAGSARKVLAGKYPEEILDRLAFEAAKIPEFGDYATNLAMIYAKDLGKPPMDFAADLAIELTLMPEVASASIAKPGFVNLVLTDKFLLDSARNSDEITRVENPLVIDMDYTGYNMGKALHIGHLRCSNVGDVLNRVFKAVGHKTISYNFIGDWGRPMGLVIAWIVEKYGKIPQGISMAELNRIYVDSSIRAKEDPGWLDHARNVTAEFQKGANQLYNEIYDWFMGVSMREMDKTMEDMNILPIDLVRGEKYNSAFVPEVKKILEDKGMLEMSDGALVIRTDAQVPMIFETSIGKDTYDTTDLTAIYTRGRDDAPDKMIYVVDFRQKFAFHQKFYIAKKADLTDAELIHISYGTITGEDNKPFKTRAGESPDLAGIISMAVDAVRKRVGEAGKSLDEEDIKAIGISALRYNDLSHITMNNYVFDPEKLSMFEGRTGAYILYTARRLASIMEKAGDAGEFGDNIDALGERALILQMTEFDRAVQRVAETYGTEILANFAYDLAQLVNNYYHNYPVLASGVSKPDRDHRLAVINMAHKTLVKAINLMGMKLPKEM